MGITTSEDILSAVTDELARMQPSLDSDEHLRSVNIKIHMNKSRPGVHAVVVSMESARDRPLQPS